VFTDLLILLLWGSATWGLWQARRRLAPTTLLSAWGWALACAAAWCTAWGLALSDRVAGPLVDQVWSLAAVLALCPMIAVLGAKRPGSRVWTWFVLLPLVAVLQWPALTLWMTDGPLPPLRLSTPVIAGFALVLLMGAGNYAATRYALSAGLTAVAVCCVLGSLAESSPLETTHTHDLRRAATVLLPLAILWGVRQARRPTIAATSYDLLWHDYRDSFGIVWGKRFLDRVNERAVAEKWPCRLTDAGFAWDAGTADVARAKVAPQIDHTFRWLLRRFVNPEWIDARLAMVPTEVERRPLTSADGL
jgi:hypothetical protein